MENRLFYDKPAQFFEEALPLGNGSLGAMVYGAPHRERLTLNLDTLWSGKPLTAPQTDRSAVFRRVQALTRAGRLREAQRLLEEDFSGADTAHYLPMGELCIATAAGEITDYCRELDLDDALHRVTFRQAGQPVCREAFISHPHRCLALRLDSAVPATYRLTLHSPLRHRCSALAGQLHLYGDCPEKLYPDWRERTEPWQYGEGCIHFMVALQPVTDGQIAVDGDGLRVENATRLELFLCAASSFDTYATPPDRPYVQPCLDTLASAVRAGYAAVRQAHSADFRALYERVQLDLHAAPCPLPTDRRLDAAEKDRGLYELLFNMGRYLLIACSRSDSQPANLQGIWNERLVAPWRSNYTLNINTEMNYWATLPCRLPECHQPLVRLLQRIADTGRATARLWYGARGYVCHHNTDLWGQTNPVGNRAADCCVYSFWPLGSAWLCRSVFDYYEYTGDRQWLADVGYPLLREAMEFYLDILVEDGDRTLLSPSTSPENWYEQDGEQRCLDRFTAMSQTMLLQLAEDTRRCCRILGVDAALETQLTALLPRLDTLQTDAQGRLMEWAAEHTEPEVHHRHLSHLYGLYPGNQITPEKRPALLEACRRSLEVRGDDGTGWSLAWKVNLWAKLKDGDRALRVMGMQLYRVPVDGKTMVWHGGSYANLLCSHPPFQIDGNLGVTAGICQLLLQSEDGKLKILPALPTDWQDGSVSGLLGKGNVSVSIEWRQYRCTALTLSSPRSQTVTVEVNGETRSVLLPAAQEIKVL